MRFQRKGKRIGLVNERQSLKKQKLDYQYKFIVKRILLQLFSGTIVPDRRSDLVHVSVHCLTTEVNNAGDLYQFLYCINRLLLPSICTRLKR